MNPKDGWFQPNHLSWSHVVFYVGLKDLTTFCHVLLPKNVSCMHGSNDPWLSSGFWGLMGNPYIVVLTIVKDHHIYDQDHHIWSGLSIYTHVQSFIFIYIYIRIYIYMYMYINVYAYIYICTDVSIPPYIRRLAQCVRMVPGFLQVLAPRDWKKTSKESWSEDPAGTSAWRRITCRCAMYF